MAPIKHNLVALGSAAVLAVYSAGYARTRTAAARFADVAERRAPVPVESEPAPVPGPAAAATVSHPVESPPPATSRSVGDSAPTRAPAARVKHGRRAADTPARGDSAPRVVSQPAPTAPPAPPATAVTPPPPTVKDTAAPAKSPPPSDTAQASKNVAYKDGTYTGWGTSRHGDVQATVMIKEGRIVGAVISECLTQYSCSWIAALPNQVIERQSAEVDYVSGATQSANAFYYAVVEALKKAK